MKHVSAALAALLSPTLLVAVAAAQPAPPPPPAEPPPPTPVEPTEAGDQPVEPVAPTSEAPLPPPPPEPVKDDKAGTAGYDKGFFLRSADDKFELKATGRVQPYYTLTSKKVGDDRDSTGAFEIRRARLTLEGHLHGPNLLYKMQTDFGKGVTALRDYHFDVKLAKDAWLRVGQWKKPFSRQQIVSSGRLETTDRAITDKAFGAGRDIGVAVRNDYEKSPELEWIVGVFNGTGIDAAQKATVDPTTGAVTIGAPSNVPAAFRPLLVGRVGLNRGGIKGYSEADLEGGPLRWGVAASVLAEADFDEDDRSQDAVELDYIVKVNGLSSTGGVYFQRKQEGVKTFSDRESAALGFHVQAGYMLSKHLQAVGRFALVDDQLDDAKDQQEITVGGGYYGFGHDAKVQANLRLQTTGDESFGDTVLFEVESNVGF